MKDTNTSDDGSFESCAGNASRMRAAWIPVDEDDLKQSDDLPYTPSDDMREAFTTIPVQKTVEYVRNGRKHSVQDLVRKYFLQIREGCGNDKCTQAACFSFQKRSARGPARRPTNLTARMQSFVLVSETNPPDSHLCDSIANLSRYKTWKKYADLTSGETLDATGTIDRKSLSQNLCSTAAMKLFFAARTEETHPVVSDRTSESEGRSEDMQFLQRQHESGRRLRPSGEKMSRTLQAMGNNENRQVEALRYINDGLVEELETVRCLETFAGGLYKNYKLLRVSASRLNDVKTCTLSKSESFFRQSVHNCLSNLANLNQSFRPSSDDYASSEALLEVMNFSDIHRSFSYIRMVAGSLMYDSLCDCLQKLLVSLPKPFSSRKVESQVDVYEDEYQMPRMLDAIIARTIFICFCALCSGAKLTHESEYYLDLTTDESARRLLQCILQIVVARRCSWEVQKATDKNLEEGLRGKPPFIIFLLDHLELVHTREHISFCSPPVNTRNFQKHSSISLSDLIAYLLWYEILTSWDGKIETRRWGHIGGAIELISDFYERREDIGMKNRQIISHECRGLESVTNLIENYDKVSDPNVLHLLSFPFLFDPDILVQCFRAINFMSMAKAFENSEYMSQLTNRFPFILKSIHRIYLNNRLKPLYDRFITLNVRRGHLLEDTFNQLWRREKRELLRPLKVIMGSGYGEEGLDQGGVSFEYFRLAINEALNPDVGMFTIDPRSKTAWFQPGSLEPLYRFELLGLIFSLALYNGVTLSIDLPRAFYRRILGLPVRNAVDMADGWPELTKGLCELLLWKDGDVSDVFMRTYDFSYEAYGRVVHIDMKSNARKDSQAEVGTKSEHNYDEDISQDQSCNSSNGTQSGSSGTIVTNATREAYVSDYVYWLTVKSIQPQFDAFARGFFTCFDRKAISFFSPALLQSLVEGRKTIDAAALQEIASYEDGYSPKHPLIQGFWSIVKEYDEQKQRCLLEFVTASDRIPVNGVQSITFAIIRSGGDCDRIPSAMTCFGKLLLPEYSSVDKLRDRLEIALENSRGFGSI